VRFVLSHCRCVHVSIYTSIVRMLAPELSGCDMMWEVTPAEPAQACLFRVDASLMLR